ncbi:DUF1285 domain-containing protein [Candidatus Spongiihabitans sp.]|uniref:DUF1285 domain-containing protein n=1 Tax=Candidatus Spongiihabitans sp. TaxID=3101308 RepID=UPI003C7B42AE
MSEVSAIFDQLEAFKLAPIDDWKPVKIIDIDIRIAANGEWFYLGSPIQRQRMVKLFSSVLRREGEQYFLVTPPAKYRIQVDDAPFVAVEMQQVKERVRDKKIQKLYFRTNMDEVILADHLHPLSVITNAQSGEPAPYITVRNDLKAKITRSVFYQLAELLQPDPNQCDAANAVGVFSAGEFFSFRTA